MKVAFFYSPRMSGENIKYSKAHIRTFIDGEEFTEQRGFADGAEVTPFNRWGDNVLVALIENVATKMIGTIQCVDSDVEPLAGRITYY